MQEFVCKHQCFRPMEYLTNTSVSLYAVHKEYVYLAETSRHEELKNLRKFPFTSMGQRVLAEKILKVHQMDLVEFTEKLPKPTCKVIWIFHSTRCGSTALAQAINSIDEWSAISEITWLAYILPQNLVGAAYEAVKSFYMSDEFSRLAQACIVSQLMHYTDSDKVCWKKDFINTFAILPVISNVFPEHKIVTMTRRGDQTAQFLYKAFFDSGITPQLPSLLLNYQGARLLNSQGGRDLIAVLTNSMLTAGVKEVCFSGNFTPYTLAYLLWASHLAFTIDICRSLPKLQALAVDYEFFIKDLRASLNEVFSHTEIDKKHLQLALDSYNQDSQENSVHLSRHSMKRNSVHQPDKREIEKCNERSKALGLPPHGRIITKDLFGFDNWRYIMK